MSDSTGQQQKFMVDEQALHAFADNQLSAAHAAIVSDWLATHPDRQAEVADWQRQNAGLAALFAPVAAEPLPARLAPRRLASGLAAERRAWFRTAAAIVLLVGLGGGGGWVLRGALWTEETPGQRLIDGALAAHALYVKESRHAVEVAASDRGHLVTWLSNRLGRAIDTPNLTTEGFTLVGGRLLPPLAGTDTGPAAQLMYQNATDNRLTVYITAAGDRGKPFIQEDRKGLQAYYWANDQITCTVVGDLPVAEMKVLAKGVYQQLTWRPDPPGAS